MHSAIKKQVVFLFLLFSFLVYGRVSAAVIEGEVAFSAGFFESSGDIKDRDINQGAKFDPEDDFGYCEESAFMGRVKILTPKRIPDFSLHGYYFDYDGDGQKDLTIGDTSYTSADFKSELTLKVYDFSVFYPIKAISTGTFDKVFVNVGGTLRWFDIDHDFSGNQGFYSNKSVDDFAVGLYGDFFYKISKELEWGVEAKLLSVTSSSFLNLTGRVTFVITSGVFTSFGYMYDNIDIDDNKFDSDLINSGYFMEVGYRF